MWLVEAMLISLVGGTILGVAWRIWDEAMEKWRANRIAEVERPVEIQTTATKTE